MSLTNLRVAVVTMAAVLASYGSAYALEHSQHLHVDVVVQAVVLSWTVAWVQRAADLPSLLLTFAVVPAVALGGVELSVLMSDHPDIGDAIFVGCMFMAIWVRRFGRLATRAGTLAVLPLIATLILVLQSPVVAVFNSRHTVWVGVVGLIAAAWVTVLMLLATLLGVASPAPVVVPTALGEPDPPDTPAAGLTENTAGRRTVAPPPAAPRRRISAHLRMALQMAVSLAVAFPVGRHWFPDHWAWVVLTAYIVCSGARSRSDVLVRGVLRAVGAGAGTAVATWIASLLGPHDYRSVVLIFVILAFATWLRSFSYVYWAGCVTAMLSLLYGYFGQNATDLLRTRLEAILVGAVIGIAASWLILPIRSAALVRRRAADALAALSALLAEPTWDPGEMERARRRFDHGVQQLDQAVRPIQLYRRLVRRWRPDAARYADAAAVLDKLRDPAQTIVRCAQNDPGLRAESGVAALTQAMLANIRAVRLTIGRRPGTRPYQPFPPRDRSHSQVGTALTDMDRGLAALNRLFSAGADGRRRYRPPGHGRGNSDTRTRGRHRRGRQS